MATTDIIESRLRGTLLDTFRINQVQIANNAGTSMQMLDDAGTSFINVESGGITAGTAGDQRPSTFNATTFSVAASGNVALNSTGGSLSLGNNADTGAINVGNGAAARSITIGNSAGATSVKIDAGTGNIDIGTTGVSRSTNIATGGANQTLIMGSTTGTSSAKLDAGTGNIDIGTSAAARSTNIATGAAAQALTMGSLTGASSTTIRAGTGNILIQAARTTITGDLVVQGTTTSVDSETVLMADNHLYLNAGYTTAVAQTGGLVVNYLPIATTTTVAAGGFTAGVAAVSNPTVITAAAAVFAVGQFIQISGVDNPKNNGLFEVLSHVGTTLTIRGIGTVACVEDFTQNQFTTDATAGGTITRLNVSVMRTGTDGLWEEGKGAVTPVTFDDLVTSSSVAGLVADIEFDTGASIVGSVTYDSAGNVPVGAYPIFVELLVETAYPGGTTITIGNSAGSATFLMVAADNKPNVTGIYRVPILRRTAAAPWTAAGKVRVTITSGGVGGTGHARLVYAPTPRA